MWSPHRPPKSDWQQKQHDCSEFEWRTALHHSLVICDNQIEGRPDPCPQDIGPRQALSSRRNRIALVSFILIKLSLFCFGRDWPPNLFDPGCAHRIASCSWRTFPHSFSLLSSFVSRQFVRYRRRREGSHACVCFLWAFTQKFAKKIQKKKHMPGRIANQVHHPFFPCYPSSGQAQRLRVGKQHTGGCDLLRTFSFVTCLLLVVREEGGRRMDDGDS